MLRSIIPLCLVVVLWAVVSGSGFATDEAIAADDVASEELCGSCCPTFNEWVDCWAEGHWHYQHCNQFCPI